MSFCIHYNQQTYTAKSFSQLTLTADYAFFAAQFVKNWMNNLPFTFQTSGSTGKPKAVTFNKSDLELSAAATIEALKLDANTTHILLCLHPKFVGGAMMLARALVLDCPITITEPSNKVLNNLNPAHPFTFVSFVPAQLQHAFFEPRFNRFKQVLIGGAMVDPKLEMKLKRLKPQSFHTYGMTETLSHIALRHIGVEKAFKTLPGYSIKLNDKNCASIKTNFNNSWLETNDLIELNKDGSFTVLGRTDFVINSGGHKIHPEQVERIMQQLNELHHLLPADFIVSAIKDSFWGEKCVCVVKEAYDHDNFIKFTHLLSLKLPKYQVPKQIVQINEWIFTDTGKINRIAIMQKIDNQRL